MRIFIISDTHFGHFKLEQLEGRPRNALEKVIKNWNRMVKPDDLVIHLGDYIVGSSSNYEHIIYSLNGRKVLLLGNHDQKSYSWYIKNGFDFACEAFYWEYMGKRILFSHEPQEKNTKWDINIHGHLHSGRHRDEYELTSEHLLFSLEEENY